MSNGFTDLSAYQNGQTFREGCDLSEEQENTLRRMSDPEKEMLLSPDEFEVEERIYQAMGGNPERSGDLFNAKRGKPLNDAYPAFHRGFLGLPLE